MMAVPTVTTAGQGSGLLLITDSSGVSHRVPKSSLADLVDTSNNNANRLEVYTSKNSIILLFAEEIDKSNFIAAIETYY